jgi:hypothetical protein
VRTSCKFNERNVVVWVGLGFWKLRSLRKGVERGRYPIYEEEEDNH